MDEWPSAGGGIDEAGQLGITDAGLPHNVFGGIRELAKYWDDEIKCLVMANPDVPGSLSIALRVRSILLLPELVPVLMLLKILHVKRIDDNTTVLTILYYTIPDDDLSLDTFHEWDDEYTDPDTGDAPTHLKSTPLQQKVLLRVLELNSRFVPPNFNPVIAMSEANFKVSFLFPIYPLSSKALEELNLDTGDAVSENEAEECSQCGQYHPVDVRFLL